MMRYETIGHDGTGATVMAARFHRSPGAEEVHLTVLPPSGGTFEEQAARVGNAYMKALVELGLPASSAVFRRVFLSDDANQAPLVRNTALGRPDDDSGPVAISFVEQPPLPERKLALWAYHVHDPSGLRKQQTPQGVIVHRERLSHLWTTGLACAGADGVPSPYSQTERILDDYRARLDGHGMELAQHAIRTWVFVQNVDVNYSDMVRARAELFARHGLTADTHYIASTGIEGRHGDPRRLVLLDAYAIAGLRSEQVRHLVAPRHLGPTHLYGVTFERGTRVDHADRSHIYISGTASIEPSGRCVHVGDALRQTERTFENIEVLLSDGGATGTDLAHMIVYLRDHADRAVVEAYVQDRYPGVPFVMVRAPVCRPEWLVEVECIAIRDHRSADLGMF